MRKYINIAVDLIIFCLAALGSLMAFGIGAAYAVLKSAFVKKNTLDLAKAHATQARRLFLFIYAHSGLPALVASMRKRNLTRDINNQHDR
jgi:hypothetical protein